MENRLAYMLSPIIIDIGSGEIKAGLSGQEKPKILFKSAIGDSKFDKIIKQFSKDNTEIKKQYIGEECDKYISVLKLRYPIKHGIFTNEEDILPIFSHVYSKLKIPPEEIKSHPLLITEPLINPYKNREKIASVLFENLDVPALIFASQPILSLYSTSATSGVVLESGEGVTQCCVVYEGYSIPSSYERYNFGGGDVNELLKTLLQNRGYYFNTSAESQIIRDIKESFCFACPFFNSENRKNIMKYEKDNYLLPDGNTIKLGEEKIIAPEILFEPDTFGMEFPSFQQIIFNSVDKADCELKPKLYDSILLSGGNTSIKGVAQKVISELKVLIKNKMKIKIHSPIKPYFLCWLGGNVVSSLKIFNEMLISKQEWEEKGKNIVHVKTI